MIGILRIMVPVDCRIVTCEALSPHESIHFDPFARLSRGGNVSKYHKDDKPFLHLSQVF